MTRKRIVAIPKSSLSTKTEEIWHFILSTANKVNVSVLVNVGMAP